MSSKTTIEKIISDAKEQRLAVLCSGQVILATVLEKSQKNSSALFGATPSLN